MRRFYRAFPPAKISETVSRNSSAPRIRQTTSGKSETASRICDVGALAEAFPLPWSHYVLLVRKARSLEALDFYHAEALRGGWSVRQLDRQIASQFYERTALSRNKAAMLSKGAGITGPGLETQHRPSRVTTTRRAFRSRPRTIMAATGSA